MLGKVSYVRGKWQIRGLGASGWRQEDFGERKAQRSGLAQTLYRSLRVGGPRASFRGDPSRPVCTVTCLAIVPTRRGMWSRDSAAL